MKWEWTIKFDEPGDHRCFSKKNQIWITKNMPQSKRQQDLGHSRFNSPTQDSHEHYGLCFPSV